MKVVIVGAGLSGLSAAYHLERGGDHPLVLERGEGVGGACATISRDGFHFDLTGHLLHIARAESETLLREIGVWSALRRHRRRAAIALAGTITPYPIQIHTHRLPAEIRRDCLLGFIRAHEAGTPSQGGSFADWVTTRFGDGLARHFFFPYNSKLFRTDPAELTTEWVGRYVPRPSLEEVVDGALGLHRGAVGYNARFLYPKEGGIGVLAKALAGRIGGVRCEQEVVRVDLPRRVVVTASGSEHAWDALIATLPLSHLAARTVGLTDEALQAAARLRAVGVVNFNFGVAGPAARREHWLYIPEPRFPFYRVGFPSNHGRCAPEGHHTISVEVSVRAGEAIEPDLPDRCEAGLRELGLLAKEASIVTRATARIDPAYVIFDRNRTQAVATLRDAYRRAGVLLVGRWAEWKYSTMEDALWDGATAARRVGS